MGFYKLKRFHRFCRRNRLLDSQLAALARSLLRGRADVDLGAGLYKLRLAKEGAGKSGGFRLMVAQGSRAHVFFLLGFEKSDRGNVSDRELHALRLQAHSLARFSEAQIAQALATGALIEVADEEAGA